MLCATEFVRSHEMLLRSQCLNYGSRLRKEERADASTSYAFQCQMYQVIHSVLTTGALLAICVGRLVELQEFLSTINQTISEPADYVLLWKER